MFISDSKSSCSTTELHQTAKVRYPFITFRGLFPRRILAAWLPAAFIALLPNASLAQATLTDDHATNDGPKSPALSILNNGGSSATTFLKFSLLSIPTESTVSRATLKLFVNSYSSGNPNQGGQFQIDVRDIGNAWSEQSPTPQNNGTLLATASVSLSGYNNFITVDITDVVREWINGTRPNNGVALGIRSGTKPFLVLDSKENTLTSQSPRLELVLDKITGVTATAGLSGGGTTGNLAVGISDGGVTTAKLAVGAVTSQNIASGAVGTSELAFGGVTSANIAAGSIGTQHLADGSVTSLKIATGAVGTPQLAPGAVTSTKIVAGSVGNQHLTDGSVTSSKIGPAAVGTPQLAAGAVTSMNIGVGAVGSAQLANGAVNSTNIADNSITSAKIASGQVVRGVNGLTDNVTLAAGSNVMISPFGNTITISATGPKLNTQQIALLRWYDANESSENVVVGLGPHRILFDGTHVWISNYNGNSVSKVRPSDGLVIGTYPAGDTPVGLAFDGSNIWVVNSTSSRLTKLRARDGSLITTYGPLGSVLMDAAFDGKYIWVTDNSQGVVRKLATDGTVVGTFAVDFFPFGVISDGPNIWVANSSNANVTKLRASDGTLLGTFYTNGQDSNGLAFDGTNVWVSNFTSGNVTKIRASDGAHLGNVPVGSGAAGVVFDGIYIWVASYNTSTMTKIRASDSQIIGTYAVGPGPAGMAFDGVNVWVANQQGNTVSKR